MSRVARKDAIRHTEFDQRVFSIVCRYSRHADKDYAILCNPGTDRKRGWASRNAGINTRANQIAQDWVQMPALHPTTQLFRTAESKVKTTRAAGANVIERIGSHELIVPKELHALLAEIRRSQSLLGIEPNLEEGIQPPSRETWERACLYLLRYATWVFYERDVVIPTPEIVDGPADTIDLIWKSAKFRLIVNIKSDRDSASFYGDNYGHVVREGSIDLTNYEDEAFLPIFGS